MSEKRKAAGAVPEGAVTTTITHEVAFYETDAMAVVHHSNYVRFFEHARVKFLAEHDRPYQEYVAQGFHVPVIGVSAEYRRPCRFAEVLHVTCWLARMRHASFTFGYRVECGGELAAFGETSHAVIDASGRPTRIPPDMHARMRKWAGQDENEPRT